MPPTRCIPSPATPPAAVAQAPSIPMVRRHARGEGQMHFAPTVQIVTGNYVTAKRRGIVNGVDFGAALLPTVARPSPARVLRLGSY